MKTPLVEIIDIVWFEQDPELLLGCNIDAPQVGTHSSIYAFEIGGWVVGRKSRVIAVELLHENRTLRSVPVGERRTDVAQHLPDCDQAVTSGFWTGLGVTGMRTEFEVLVQVVLDNDLRVPLATIRGRHKPIGLRRKSALQPLMVTTWGRTGSTLLMKLLLEHPQIVGFRQYPYEMRVANYWMHLLKIVTEPGNHTGSAHPDNFTEDLQWIGHMPFYTEPLTANPRLRRWLGKHYIELAAGFCQRSIQGFYRQLAQAQKQSKLRYFAEKNHPTHTSWLFWELYPGAREIILVRDFRDMICSIFAFNQKRGFASFGLERTKSSVDFIELQRVGAESLLDSWRRRQDSAMLVRYEDLVLRPAEMLNQIFTYLNLECDAAFVANSLEAACDETPELQKHRTSFDARASIGRWQTELSSELQERCLKAFGPVLTEFGYAV